MLTASFWIAALERGAKTAAQSVLSVWAVGDGMLNVLTVDWALGAGVAGGGFVLSLLSSIASAGLGPAGSPSLVSEPGGRHAA